MKKSILSRLLSIFVITLFSVSLVHAQYTDEELAIIIKESPNSKLVKLNSELLLKGMYKQAAIIAEDLVRKEPSNANFQYRLGYAYLNYHPDIKKPIAPLRKASENVTKKYDASSEKETSAPIDAIYYLGKAEHRIGNLSAAVLNYQKFIETAEKKNALSSFAELGLLQCEVAKELMNNPSDDILLNLGDSVNSPKPEYAPVISLDGTSLFFTSRRLWKDSSNIDLIDPATNNYLEDIFVSFTNDQDEWVGPKMLEFCIPEQNEATVSVSIDERKIYVYNDASGNGDIYYSQYNRGIFNAIQPVDKENVNTKDWEPHLYVTPDGSEVYFVSDRPDGFGGRDIYVMRKTSETTWSEPENLGPEINTPYDEDAPFVSIDNQALYFASNGPTSMGGFDIFISERNEEGAWMKPINMGVPINSTGDDAFYTTTTDGFKGYITSFREGGKGDLDIYEIQHFPPRNTKTSVLKGQVIVLGDQPLPEDIAITVKCLNCDKPSEIQVFPRTRDGMYFSKLDKCKEYELTYTHNNGKTEFHKAKIASNCLPEHEEIYKPAYLRLDDMTIVPYYALQINSIDLASNASIGDVTVEIVSSEGELLETINTNENGLFTSELLRARAQGEEINLTFNVKKEGYLTKKIDFNADLGEENIITASLLLEKAGVGEDLGKILKLNPIYFDLNSSYIRKDAKPELQKVIDAMNANPDMVIECRSHTDCRQTYEYNEWLSDRRAKRSVNYIQKRITNPSRISGKGFGENQLVNDCACEGDVASDCSEEDHQLNRRTEFIIIKN
jgi:outer membrane protein OmpA-like peptidoglycan-associated protein/tetratricopeptide (TPR) repeat protein